LQQNERRSDVPAQLNLNLYDVRKNRILKNVNLRLRHLILHQDFDFNGLSAKKTIPIQSLNESQGGRYILHVEPGGHRSVSGFIQVGKSKPDTEDYFLPIDPQKVRQTKFPAYKSLSDSLQHILERSDIEGFPNMQGKPLYEAVDPLRKAGLLNIYTKMIHTLFANQRNVFSYLESLTRLRGDRFFARVARDLRDEVKNAVLDGAFQEVDGALHTPPPDFQPAGSFKTPDHYGNLQLTFFSKPKRWTSSSMQT
jgi:hypothetical protein